MCELGDALVFDVVSSQSENLDESVNVPTSGGRISFNACRELLSELSHNGVGRVDQNQNIKQFSRNALYILFVDDLIDNI